MPYTPKRGCRYPGCSRRAESGAYCAEHAPQTRPAWDGADERRGNPAQRGYDNKWRAARRSFLAENPLCAECMKEGRYTAATVVDHITPHRGDRALFWDRNNWQPLCGRHHAIKTASGR